MPAKILHIAASIYLLAALGRVLHWKRPGIRFQSWLSVAEKLAYIVFTGGLVVYIQSLDVASTGELLEESKWPVSWLLLAWSIGTAHLVSELAHGNRFTAAFANTWIAVSLLVPSPLRSSSLSRMFTHELEWLSFHRLCFMLAYAFCLLALPLVVETLWRGGTGKGSLDSDPILPQVDRLSFRLILWALPLLTVGFLVEALLMLERREFPSPAQIWTERKEMFLALATWFTCGVYLHMRLFHGWKARRSAVFFITCLVFVLAGHLSKDFIQFSAALR